MPEQNFTEIGRLHVQVQFNEKELEGLRREGNEIATLLRVIADCLDLEHDAKVKDYTGIERMPLFQIINPQARSQGKHTRYPPTQT